MELSVIILNYNVRHFLELCLRSVEQAVKGLSAEIIVVDNNSIDDSCAMVKHYFPSVKLIENIKNVGFAKANNQAVLQAKGSYICILNPDTVVTENTFIGALKKAKSISNLGLLGVQLIDGKGNFLPESKRHLPTPKVSVLKLMGGIFSKFAPYYVNTIAPKAEGEITVLAGAFMLCKKEIYNQANGFDEDYFMYGEDIDLSYKIQKLGYSNYYFGSESVVHFKGESTLKDATYRKYFFGAMKLFYNKHFKSSIFIDTVIYSGIKFSSLIKIKKKQRRPIIFQKEILISDNKLLFSQVQQVSKIEVEMVDFDCFEKYTKGNEKVCCLLDMSFLEYSSAIKLLEKYRHTNISFRFIPKNALFATGSDTSSSRGQVISFAV